MVWGFFYKIENKVSSWKWVLLSVKEREYLFNIYGFGSRVIREWKEISKLEVIFFREFGYES